MPEELSSSTMPPTSDEDPCDGVPCCPEETGDTSETNSTGANDLAGPGVEAAGGDLNYNVQHTNQPSLDGDYGNGYGWIPTSQPYLTENGTTITVVYGPRRKVDFDYEDGNYTARYAAKQKLTHDAENDIFKLSEADGTVIEFHDFDQATEPEGRLKQSTDPGGNVTQVTGYNDDDRITGMSRTVGDVTESLAFAYYTSGDNADRLQQVTLSQTENSQTTYVSKVVYSYCDSQSSNGNLGDLETAVKSVHDGSNWVTAQTRHYRYYKSNGNGGYLHGLKYVVGPDAYRAMVADSLTPESVTDSVLADYADRYFEYDSTSQRVTKEVQDGGSREFRFTYTAGRHADSHDHWKLKQVRTEVDSEGTTLRKLITYTNFRRQRLLRELQSANGLENWIEAWAYDSDGRRTKHIFPSAIASYDDDSNEDGTDVLAITYNTDESAQRKVGYIEETEYYTMPETGGVVGYKKYDKIRNGPDNTAVVLAKYEYTEYTAGNASAVRVTKMTRYTEEDETGGLETTYGYEHHIIDSSNTVALEQRTTTDPTVAESENGDGSTVTRVERFDEYGNLVWEKDERGYLTHHEYDTVLSVRVKTIEDVQVTSVTDEPTGWTTPTDGGKHLVTEFEYDAQGRLVQTLGPEHTIDVNGTATVVRRATWNAYADNPSDGCTEIQTASGYATDPQSDGSWDTYTLINPVQVVRRDARGRTLEQFQATTSTTGTRLSTPLTFSQETDYTSWTTYQYDYNTGDTDGMATGRLVSTRVYHSIPTSGDGVSETNYAQTEYGYDKLGRQNMQKSPGGTITRAIFDLRDQTTKIYVGTDDTDATDADPTGDGALGNNMKCVEERVYDDGMDGGGGCACSGSSSGGNVTQIQKHVDASPSKSRMTNSVYDWRNRRTVEIADEDDEGRTVYTVHEYDNLDRLEKTERYLDVDEDEVFPDASGDRLLGREQRSYDARDRVYKTTVHEVDPSTGTVGSSLSSYTWYDAAGHVVKELPGGTQQFTKTTYDSLGRAVTRYVGVDADGNEPVATTGTLAAAMSVSDDTILEESTTDFDAAGNAIKTVTKRRLPTASGSSSLGDESTQPYARLDTVGHWHDALGRTIASAQYGTGSFTRTTQATVPSRSATVLVTEVEYDSAGRAYQTTDPAGKKHRSEFDAAGRQTKTIQNYLVSGDTGYSATATDQNLTVETAYTLDGQVASLTAHNADTGNQVTTYVYGTTLSDSEIARSDLLRAEIYPDSDDSDSPLGDGVDTTYDRVEYKYNRQGERVELKDQNGTVHAYEFDHLGRLIADKVTTPGTGVDTNVRRIDRKYEVRGMIARIISYSAHSNPTTNDIVNDVVFEYDNMGRLVKDRQSHDGAADASSPEVEYTYPAVSGGKNRLSKITYPSGRDVNFNYGTANETDDLINRPTALLDNDGSTHLADYSYLGAQGIIKTDYPEPDLRLDHTASGALDAFGRVIDHRWVDYGASADAVRIKHGYDEVGNRLWREDDVSANLTPAVHADEHYTYDKANRLLVAVRGDLNAAKTGLVTDTGTYTQVTALDKTGNWKQNYRDDDLATPGWDLSQTRTHNKANEVTQLAGSAAHVAHDAAGNMTRVPIPGDWSDDFDLTFDAWNRLVAVDDGSEVVAEYEYDGRNFRIVKTTEAEIRHYFYTQNWQCVEERATADDLDVPAPELLDPDMQYVWGLRYIDDLILRDRDASAPKNGTLNERLYAMQDPNWNVVALADPNGDVVERYLYSAYGDPLVLNADFSDDSNGTDYAWEFRFTGRRTDLETELMYYRNRMYHPNLGRFVSRDPVGYNGGYNTYEYVFGQPLTFTDALGLKGLQTCAAVRYKSESKPINLKIWKFKLKFSDESVYQGTECKICCSDGSPGVTFAGSYAFKWKLQTKIPVYNLPIGPVQVPISVIPGGEGGGKGTAKWNTCTGERSLKGCGYVRGSLGIEGCVDARWLGINTCVTGQGFGRCQWCIGDESPTCCAGVRVSVKLCWGWYTKRCREYILHEVNNCGPSSGDEGGG